MKKACLVFKENWGDMTLKRKVLNIIFFPFVILMIILLARVKVKLEKAKEEVK